MRGTIAREEAAQRLLASAEPISSRHSSRLKSGKGRTEDLARLAVSLHASDRLILLYGHSMVSRLALQFLADRALSGQPVVYLDGFQTFDTPLIERLARSRRQPIRKVLAMIHVARAFSAQQLERLMSQCLLDALERYQARMAVISGLLETLSADGLTDHEMNRLVDRTIDSVHHLTQRGVSLLCPCSFVPMPQTPVYRLFAALRTMSDRCIRLHEVQGKVVTEDMSADATPLYDGLYEASA